ncbi:unnamed protein product, partial [Pylaiella littoralis]
MARLRVVNFLQKGGIPQEYFSSTVVKLFSSARNNHHRRIACFIFCCEYHRSALWCDISAVGSAIPPGDADVSCVQSRARLFPPLESRSLCTCSTLHFTLQYAF